MIDDKHADLSVIIPAYNEGKTIATVIETVLKTPRVAEVIVVNDGSTDDTLEQAAKFKDRIKLVARKENRGKGYSVREGIELATAKYTIVQDADLELSPASYVDLFAKLEETGADMVNCYRSFDNPNIKFISKLASKTIPMMVFLLYGKYIRDIVSCYKLMETEKYQKLDLKSDRFEIETEMIVKTLKNGYKIVEAEVPFAPRSVDEGKHIRWTDGLKVFRFLVKQRLGIN